MCPPPSTNVIGTENDKRMNLQKMCDIVIYIVIGITNDLYRDMIFWSYRTALVKITASALVCAEHRVTEHGVIRLHHVDRKTQKSF